MPQTRRSWTQPPLIENQLARVSYDVQVHLDGPEGLAYLSYKVWDFMSDDPLAIVVQGMPVPWYTVPLYGGELLETAHRVALQYCGPFAAPVTFPHVVLPEP